MPRRIQRAAAVALCLAVGGVAAADEKFDWDRASGSKRKKGADDHVSAMRRGDQLATRAAEQVNLGDANRGKNLALRAVTAYEEAIALDGKKAEPHYRAAEVLSKHFIDGINVISPGSQIEHPTQRAIRHWVEFERLAPRDPRLAEILFRRSLAYTKLGGEENYRKSIADYAAELRLIDAASQESEQMATLLSNAAEIHMALGEIDQAIELYREALEFASRQSPLHAYGLAVALDRDGQATRAREIMTRRKYDSDVLFPKDGGVFFVPEGDVFWYQALGVETLGQYDRALNYYRRFVGAQPSSPYVARAKEHIKRLEAKVKSGKKAPELPNNPFSERTWSVP